jgi:molecular chaperone GrpE
MNEETSVRNRDPRGGRPGGSDPATGERDPVTGEPAGTGETVEQAPPVEPGAASAGAAVEGDIDFRDRWLRAEADLQNFRRRAQRELEEARRTAEESVLLDLISALDDLERAIQSAREAGAPESWVEGVALVASRMQGELAKRGVTAVDPVGERFDPELHEALLEVDAPADAEDGHVVQVVRKGYRRNGRALRAARVVVGRKATVGEG